jgi:hypothetical protein
MPGIPKNMAQSKVDPALEKTLRSFPTPDLLILERLANASYQIIMEGTSYCEKLSPHRRKGVLTQ